jgi:hypothetical protein
MRFACERNYADDEGACAGFADFSNVVAFVGIGRTPLLNQFQNVDSVSPATVCAPL